LSGSCDPPGAPTPPSVGNRRTPGLFQDRFAGSSKWFHLWLFGQISGRILALLADISGSTETGRARPSKRQIRCSSAPPWSKPPAL
jgi:hypothetical protein